MLTTTTKHKRQNWLLRAIAGSAEQVQACTGRRGVIWGGEVPLAGRIPGIAGTRNAAFGRNWTFTENLPMRCIRRGSKLPKNE
jgi:hypothetical protein